MILALFVTLFILALVLVIIGLTRPLESAQAIVGFVFIFLLSTGVLLPGNLQVQTGAQTNTTYGYDSQSLVNSTVQDISYSYENFDDSSSRQFGLYSAIASVVGFVGVLVGIRRTRKNEWQNG